MSKSPAEITAEIVIAAIQNKAISAEATIVADYYSFLFQKIAKLINNPLEDS